MTNRPALTRLDALRGLRVSIWEAVWSTVWATLTGGAFQTGFALMLGASPVALGVMSGLPAAVGLLQIPGSLYVEKRGERKGFVAGAAVAGRLLWLPILFLPFLLPRPFSLWAFLLVLTVSSALLTVTVPAWTSWMSDLVPPQSRGRYFGQRNMLAGVVTMLAPLPAGAFLDQAVKYNRFDPRIAFAVLFGLASVAAVGAWTMIRRQPEPPMERHNNGDAPVNPLRSLSVPLADSGFRRFLVFSATLVVGQSLAGQFFMAWQLDRNGLNLPYLTVQILGAVAAGAGLLATPVWGYLLDKYGSRPVLMISCAGVIAAPLIWVFTTPGALFLNLALIVLLNLFSGVFWGGVGMAQFNLLLGVTPDPRSRGTYVAMFSAVTGIVGGAAPVAGGALMALFAPVHAQWGPYLTLNNYKILFLITAVIRVVCLLLVSRVRESEGRAVVGTRDVLERLTVTARPVTSFFELRRLSRPTGENERRGAIAHLSELRSPLAVEELIAALDDVSGPVRQGAVRALGEIGDHRATLPLAAKLFDPAADIGEAVAHALGFLGDKTALPALMQAANGPDAGVCVAALKALGRLGDPAALPALEQALDPAHPTACETACASLALIAPLLNRDDVRRVVGESLLPLLAAPHAGVARGVRLAAARALLSLARPAADEEMRAGVASRLAREDDRAVSAQIALALAAIGCEAQSEPDALAHDLLSVLDRTGDNGLAYKQALQAVASVGLSDDAFYPYLGLSEAARDEAANKLIEEMARKAARDRDAHRQAALIALGETYARGHYAECLIAAAALVPPKGETFVMPINGVDSSDFNEADYARATFAALAMRADARQTATALEALLGILLLRALA